MSEQVLEKLEEIEERIIERVEEIRKELLQALLNHSEHALKIQEDQKSMVEGLLEHQGKLFEQFKEILVTRK